MPSWRNHFVETTWRQLVKLRSRVACEPAYRMSKTRVRQCTCKSRTRIFWFVFLFIGFIGVTLVNRIIPVAGAQVHSTSPVHRTVRPPPPMPPSSPHPSSPQQSPHRSLSMSFSQSHPTPPVSLLSVGQGHLLPRL